MLIEMVGVSKAYNPGKQNEVNALRDVSLSVEKGTLVAIIGPSGSGKSTLLKIIGCLDKATTGKCIVDGIDVGMASDRQLAHMRNAKIGFVLQEFGLIEDRTILENIYVPLLFSRRSIKSQQTKATAILKHLGIAGIKKKPVSQLSGGQKQRVAIARALISDPDIILADEPTGALDTGTSGDVMSLFEELNTLGKTIIIVTHNPEIAERCHKIYTLVDGVIR